MAATGYSARALLNWGIGSQPMPALASRYLALFTAAPTDSDGSPTEPSGGSYARVQIAGSITAGGTWTTSSTTITMGSANPGWVVAGMIVYDTTASAAIGTVSTYSGTTLTLTAAALHASSGSTDNLTFSACGTPTSQGPATSTSGAIITFPQATASWGTITSWGVYDALTAGDLLVWDWLGNDPWFPFSAAAGSSSTFTAPGITAGSPGFANNSSVAATARFDGATLPTGMTAETIYTVAGLSSDTFNVGSGVTGTGAGLIRQLTQQAIAANVTFSFPASNFIVAMA